MDDAYEAHRFALQFGGRGGILNENGIRSAVARPYNGHYLRIHHKAAALVESVINNHGFVDGNKRTALILLNTLLQRSGYKLRSDPKPETDRALEEMILAVATGGMRVAAITAWFKDRIERA
ncbi:MAG TPA: type II toxin-antitoxin system death-on-curing family toxin [Alphaproteobacteria bacterium]